MNAILYEEAYEMSQYFLHGGDYNPEQWLKYPEILKQDIAYMKEVKANTFSVGIFSWSALEPAEGKFCFDWLDEIMDTIDAIGGKVILATPSGARPAWLAQQYPEVLRTNQAREKCLYGARHNHCLTSPVYREKVRLINEKLALRYGKHPALLMWHISNEYGGDCHCKLCQEAFRVWLKQKYGTLEELNHAWWNSFWSHTITDWSQIESPSRLGDQLVHGLNLDWRRFVSDQTIDFFENEIAVLRKYTPNVAITTNMMAESYDLAPFRGLNYGKFAQFVDVISWDCYPAWHNDWETTAQLACKVGFINDLYRSLKKQPFLIMECTPSAVNWHEVNRTKRPGMHLLSSMQLIAHGSDSVLYFQWRQSRGASEKFHGAVVGHDGRQNNRVFQEVKQVGESLQKIKEIKGLNKYSRVAIIYDWENDWALEDVQGFSKQGKQYVKTLQQHYQIFWQKDIPVDVITCEQPIDEYDLVIVGMLYMMSEAFMEKLTEYVTQGGTVVMTYLSGIVDKHDLVYLGGWHKSLQQLFGIDVIEIDTLYPKQTNSIIMDSMQYEVKDICSVIQNNSAEILAYYENDFYAQTAAVTRNHFEKGKAYFLGARTHHDFLEIFYSQLIDSLKLTSSWVEKPHPDVSIQTRESDTMMYYFVMNFSHEERWLTITESGKDLLTQEECHKQLRLSPYQVRVVSVKK